MLEEILLLFEYQMTVFYTRLSLGVKFAPRANLNHRGELGP
jgi:hypothetical protein